MKISQINNYFSRNNKVNFEAKQNNNPIKKDDFDNFSYSTPAVEPSIISIKNPKWDILRIQGNLMYSRRNAIEELGKKIMHEGYHLKVGTPYMKKEASDIAQESKEKFEDALKLIEEAKANKLQTIINTDSSQYWSRREVRKENGNLIITEFDDEDTSEVLREIKLTPENIIVKDVSYFSGYVDEYIFDVETGILLSLTKGKNDFINGGYKAKEIYEFFSTGELKSHKKGVKLTKNNDESADIFYEFDKNYITRAYQDYYNGNSDNQTTIQKALIFTNGELTQADIDYKEKANGEKTASKRYLFDTRGNIDAYVSDIKEKTNGITTAESIYNFKNGIIDQMISKYEAFVENKVASAKRIFKISWDFFFVESCTTNNKGYIGDKYRICDCHSENVAKFFKF